MIDHSWDQRFAEWLRENRQQILEQWMDLVRIPSVRGEAAPGAPFGVECARALEQSAGYFSDSGLDVRLCRDSGYALATTGRGEKSICFFAHSDVVPAGEDWLFTRPFEPVIRDGMLIGRGASDNKSGVMAALCVLTMLKECGVPLRAKVQAFVGSNEESGMADIRAFVRQERMPDICLVPDSVFPCSLGEKGILRLWARCGKKLTAVREMKGGEAFNTVLDRVDAVLEPSEALASELRELCEKDPAFTLQIGEDGTIHLGADGVAKHVASPDGSVNAAWRMAKLLSACRNLPREDREILGAAEAFLASHWGEGLGIAHEDSHFGRLSAVCGMVAVEEGQLQVSLDIRYGTEYDPNRLEQQLRKAWGGAGWEITYLENRPGFLVDPDSPVPEMIRKVYRDMSGNDKPCYYMAGGTYSRFLKNAYTVGNRALHADREGPGMVMPAGHGGAHQCDEAIDIESFFLAVRILAQCVLACDRML